MEEVLTAQLPLSEAILRAATTIEAAPADEWTVGLIESRLELLESYWYDFVGNHLRLLNTRAQGGAERYFEERTYQQTEQAYVTSRGILYEARRVLTQTTPVPSVSEHQHPHRCSTVKLPRIEIPRFDGKLANWETFQDHFQSIIHEDTSLSDLEKMSFLKSHVDDQAKRALAHLNTTAANYSIAWSTLKSRYDRPRLLVQDHLRDLIRRHPFKKESASELQSLVDDLEYHRAWLLSLGRPVESKKPRDPIRKSKFMLRAQKQAVDVQALDQGGRKELATKKGLCFNCLVSNHTASSCSSLSRCQNCQGKHHTLIHNVAGKRASTSVAESEITPPAKTAKTQAHVAATIATSKACTSTESSLIVLPTASIIVGDGRSRREKVRALIDPCAEATLTTARIARRLGDGILRTNVDISGVNGVAFDRACIRTHIRLHLPNHPEPLLIQVYGLRHIGIVTPSRSFPASLALQGLDVNLADPRFSVSNEVDVVLGADVYSQILLPGHMRVGRMAMQATVFGWMLTGSISTPSPLATQISSVTTQLLSNASCDEICHEQLLSLVQRFWATEELPSVVRHSKEDLECERLFSEDCHRDASGRYIVPLPIKRDQVHLLGESLSQAQSALSALHRRMKLDPELKEEYTNFMDEYIQLGHMRPLTDQELASTESTVCYLPHHGIWQRTDNGRKLRVVFNASRATSSGYSLNDVLYAGPKLQNDLAVVVTRWRRHRIAFCADIKMMYRQIRIKPSHTHLQRILWSPSAEIPAVHLVLLTVTYGTTSAPYLALRTLKQLCLDEGEAFPEAVDAIKHDLYVDDFLCGADNRDDALRRKDELISLLARGGFQLKKWVSNDRDLLNEVQPGDRLRQNWIELFTGGPVNELGLSWDPVEDRFQFSSPNLEYARQPTKRIGLSELAHVFDPAGWLAPLTVAAKMIIQDLWRAKLEWDTPLPEPWLTKWRSFRNSLGHVGTVSLPRWIRSQNVSNLELHAFADASRRGLAAVVYSRAIDNEENTTTSLLMAKTKLAPIKGLQPQARTTIPRLELRAALLTAKLLRFLADSLAIPLESCCAWSDSQIVLHWLRTDKPTGHDLVDNYVSHLHELVPGVTWRYVPSADNPADAATRGLNVNDLSSSQLWWSGPAWLSSPIEDWPANFRQPPDTFEATIEERNTQCFSLQTSKIDADIDIFARFSDLNRLLRAVVRCRRLFRRRNDPNSATPLSRVTVDELQWAFECCARLSQEKDFSTDRTRILQGLGPSRHSQLRTLSPFLDEFGVLRVGGRLQRSLLSYDEKHPVILDGKSHLARLILTWAHSRSLHGGFRSTLFRVLQRAWIIGGRGAVRRFVKGCVVCAIFNARPMQQEMAKLPEARVTPSRPFSKCDVYYAGPFSVLRTKGRGVSTSKGYIALFVCLSTKAIHLELVGDLTTEAFLGALSRFCGRRGFPVELWSDNGTNFRGASGELLRMLHNAELDWGKVEGELAKEGVKWNFIPPSSPHFGGIWESNVKSTKAHLRRVAGPHRLVYEEFYTLLVEIEAALNSRPLTPLSGDPDDLEALTPSHFLVGESLSSIPRPSRANEHLDHLHHWKLIQALRDHFWLRWSKEYLHTLQQRNKWMDPRPNLAVGDFVVILDPSLIKTDGKWPMGRVTQVHPGDDGQVRVVDVRSHGGTYRRPIVKLAKLPIAETTTRHTRPISSNEICTAGGC